MEDAKTGAPEVDLLYERLRREAEEGGYHLNPDVEFARDLVLGLITNKKRYGYWACPCRLASGKKSEDLDIICPCDYRDMDLAEHDMCYCALYVSEAVTRGKKKLTGSIPERRPSPEERRRLKASPRVKALSDLPLPVWRCKVCGYLCAKENAPLVCPVCKAKKDRFEQFL